MGRGEISNSIIKIILISAGIFAFISFVSSTYQIMRQNSPEVLDNCITTHALLWEKNNSGQMISKDTGIDLLKSVIGGNFTFAGNTVDMCNPSYIGYVYRSSDNATYVVCENEKIHKIENVCDGGGKVKSLESMLTASKRIDINAS